MSVPPEIDAHGLRQWLIERISVYADRPAADIRPDVPLSDYGVGSVYVLTLAGDIEDHLGTTIDPGLLWQHSTVDALTTALLTLITT